MKFKKLLAALLAAGMVWSLAACGTGAAPKEKGEPPSQQETGKEAGASEPEAPPENAVQGSQIFGKVKAVAGNELTLSMAKMPVVEDEAGEKPGAGGDAGGMAEMMPATEMMPAQEGGGAIEQPKIELEYTGEEKDYTVPAGAPIIGTTGQNETIQSIQKGSVLLLNLDKNGGVISITVCE